jgi:CHAD domain-containing protein/CYTH domain-containing protein
MPVRHGIRLVARRHLEDGAAARSRLTHHPDEEALHDFRVALRRLRTWLRAWRPWFEDTVRKRDRNELREIARATNEARDLEVQLAWLESHSMPPDAAEGARWLAEQLNRSKREADRSAARAAHHFPALSERLKKPLASYITPVSPEQPPPYDTCGHIAAGIAVNMATQLRGHLATVRQADNAEAAHDARIAGKRLRYVLEPFRDDVEQGKHTINLLRDFQDELGGLHDIDVMIGLVTTALAAGAADSDERIPRKELMAFASYVESLRAEAYATARDRWCGAAGEKLFQEVDRFAHALSELSSPAPLEIERKFLLSGVPRRRKNRRMIRIDQGWLPGERVFERVRRVRSAQGTRWFRTVKIGRGLSRIELEEEIDHQLFNSLWKLTRGRRVRKNRYVFRDDGGEWVVDRFEGRNLVLAEIELDSASRKVEIPAWLKPYVVRDVTGDRQYENVNLAR